MKQLVRLPLVIAIYLLTSFSTSACICSSFLTIDSLPQLKSYDFIALVKITDDKVDVKKSDSYIGTIGVLTIKVIELFKGQQIEKVIEYERNTSCDIGISKGEEWLLFGKMENGNIAIHACDRNERYKEKNGLRDWKYERGFRELKKLRTLYQHPIKIFENEKRKEFYAGGGVEIEETYVDGKRNGERKIWYPNGVLFCRQFYINDTLDGRSEWFYASGQLYDEDYYIKGRHCNVSRLYYENAHYVAGRKIQPQYEIVFDSWGWSIVAKEYSRDGKLMNEDIFDHHRKFKTMIYYHENGKVSSVGYTFDNKHSGHYQTYKEDGFPGRGWDYNENGEVIK